MYLTVRSHIDIEIHLDKLRQAAEFARGWITSQGGDSLLLLKRMKFEPVGFHPIDHRALNLIEQINQTFTYAVALAATRTLLELHPEAGGFRIAPGAHASIPLDIMSEVESLVGAETFAATTPHSNNKLKKDIDKLSIRSEVHRYVFFASPSFGETKHLPFLDRSGVQVWSIALE